ncbi:ankyrin repeat domain-containing protein [Paraburkholderia tropica]|uniref:ankyrin repeat domain-containing protein n=1 Tax=Paraburkholderia tropica TaxID=92647 RepID=UPI002AB09863|nr:ankyrin repeat domain-containing protein [Paraburkholderia tropica]
MKGPAIEHLERLDEELREAARRGNAKSLRSLLSQGAGVASISADGWTTLMLATTSRKAACLKLLLPLVDPTRRTRTGTTALMIAAGMGWSEGVALLLAAIESRPGGSRHLRLAPTLRDGSGRTPLILAAQARSIECVRLLLPASDPNACDADRRTALMWAAEGADAQSVDCLNELLPTSDAGKRDRRGRTALLLAASVGSPAAVDVLLPFSDLSDVDKAGRSAFDIALGRGDKNGEAVRQILRRALAEKEGSAIAALLTTNEPVVCEALRPRSL